MLVIYNKMETVKEKKIRCINDYFIQVVGNKREEILKERIT